MKVLDATFAIDYEDGVEATKEYLQAHPDEVFVMPAPTLLEVLIGEIHYQSQEATDLLTARERFDWVEVCPVSEETIMCGGEVADEIGPQGPQLSMPDALVAGTGRELGAPVVSHDSDLTHEETKRVLDIEEYR